MTALPPDAQRQLMRLRSLEPPLELVDSIMAEVEATPQVRPVPDPRTVAGLVLVAAAVLLAVAVLLRFGTPNVGPSPTPVPLDDLPSAGSVTNRISIEADDVPSIFGHGYLWLTNARTGELVRMDPANGSIVTPIVVTEAGSPVPIAITDSSVWVADARDSSLVELDPESREELQRLPRGQPVDALAADGADLWVIEGDQFVRIEAEDGSASVSASVAGASAVLVHAAAVWAGDELGSVIRIDPASGEETGRVDVGGPVQRLLASGGSVVVVGDPGEAILRVDIGRMEVASRGIPVTDASTADGQVWAVVDSGHLVRLDPDTLQPIAADPLDITGTDSVLAGGGAVWTPGRDDVGDSYLLQIAPAQ